jgi:hypothetical protein
MLTKYFHCLHNIYKPNNSKSNQSQILWISASCSIGRKPCWSLCDATSGWVCTWSLPRFVLSSFENPHPRFCSIVFQAPTSQSHSTTADCIEIQGKASLWSKNADHTINTCHQRCFFLDIPFRCFTCTAVFECRWFTKILTSGIELLTSVFNGSGEEFVLLTYVAFRKEC